MILRKYTQQYKNIMALAAPVILANAGQVVVQLVDNIMVGRLGADELAAAAFGGAIVLNVMVLGQGFSYGLTPIVGEAYSQGGHKSTAQFFQNSMVLNLVIGVVLTGVLFAVYPLLASFGQPDVVVELSRGYYIYLTLSIIPFMLFFSFKQFMEGVGNTHVSMYITIASNLINILFNYLLIYGKFGFPEMRVAGAGLATLISRIALPIIYMAFFLKRDSYKRYFSFFNRSVFDLGRLKTLSKLGVPIASQMFMEIMAFSVTSIMMGWIGAVQLAANQIAVSMSYFSFMVINGVAAATTISVSHCYGRGDIAEMRKTTTASYHIMGVLVLLSATSFIVFRTAIASVFTTDPMVIDVAAQLMIMAGIFQISDGTQAVTLGMLRGLQDVKSPMIYAFFSYIVINIPIGYLLAFVFNMGPVGLWIGFIFGLSCAAVLFKLRYNKLVSRFSTTADGL